MNESLAPTLFQQILGSAYYGLAPCVRQLHGVRGTARYAGRASIERGRNPLAHLCARIAGLPPAMRDAATTVEFATAAEGEAWRRDFDGRHMTSRLAHRDGLLQERLGPVQFRYILHARDGALWWQVARVRLLGLLPLPVVLFDGIRCREREHDGRYEFLVEAAMPLLGLVIRYEGWLAPVDNVAD